MVWLTMMAALASGESVVLEAPVLRVLLPQGDVSVVADPAATAISLEIDRARWGEHCSMDVGVEGTEAVVRGVREGGPMRMCRANVSARVPPATRVIIEVTGGDVELAGNAGGTVQVGLGDIIVAGVTGTLEAEIATGDLVGSFLGERLVAKVSSGQVRLAGLVCPADVSVTLGRLELAYDRAPDGEISVFSAAGRATILLPAGTTVALGETDARMGNLLNELPVDEASKTVIRGKTHAGNIHVLSGGPPVPPAL